MLQKIMIGNEYGVTKEYRIISSQPQILHVESDYIILKAKESVSLSVTFLPYKKAEAVEVCTFFSLFIVQVPFTKKNIFLLSLKSKYA